MQTIFDDRWISPIRVLPRKWTRSYLPATVVGKPYSSILGLRQCCNARPGRSGDFECLRTSPQKGNELHGRCPKCALAVNEEVPYHLGSKVPVVPDWDPSRAIAQDQPGLGAGPDSSAMVAGDAGHRGIRQFGFRRHVQKSVRAETYSV